MAPAPYVFKDENELVKKLQSKTTAKKIAKYYQQDKSLDDIVKKQVSSNTYRAFKKSAGGIRPSDVFKKWVRRFIVKNNGAINNIDCQNDYDRFVHSATMSLCKYWKSRMKYDVGYGRAAKLLNLVLKILPVYLDMSARKKKLLISFLHVPLDSFTIRGLINIASFRIPSNASMGIIATKSDYFRYQNLIRSVSKKANVSPIYYDTLAWDLAH
jgi:hypothetical protein